MYDTIAYVALDRHFLAVACFATDGGWCCFGGVVPGDDHFDEMQHVVSQGTRIEKEVATAIFRDSELRPDEFSFEGPRKC